MCVDSMWCPKSKLPDNWQLSKIGLNHTSTAPSRTNGTHWVGRSATKQWLSPLPSGIAECSNLPHFKMHNIDQILSELQRFSWADYIAFVAMFLLCIFIGIYFGFMKKSVSEDDYMLGGRKMLVLPIACSLVASFISGITLLGLPTEVYSYGTQYLYVSLGVLGMGITMGVFYLPVFHDLNITSTYEVRNLKGIGI